MEEKQIQQAFQELIRIPSVTGTPGEEQACAYLEQLLSQMGVATRRICRVPERPNLLAVIRAEHVEAAQPPQDEMVYFN